jgi:predicted alpha/beta superfamily hydrolase
MAESQKRLVFRLTTVPIGEEDIYLTGNFNDWKESDERFRMKRVKEGWYELELDNISPLPHTLEYKYTRGDWRGVELDRFGNDPPNRKVSTLVETIYDHVPFWKKNGLAYDPAFLPTITVISEHFEIPQLIKTRRISVLLPHDYERSERRYPTLYLQDGQNLFDDFAPFGNWAVDKKLAFMAEHGWGDIIIVAIDHAKEERIKEFTPPLSKAKFGKGEGKQYVRFLADTLKPHIDKHFRTLPERENVGIGGSSMGGLISIYAGIMYPEVYGKLMIFSPSLWVVPDIHHHALPFDNTYESRIYAYAGAAESANMVVDMENFRRSMVERGGFGNIKFRLTIDPTGKHNEKRWGEEFPRAMAWLFHDDDIPGQTGEGDLSFSLTP